MLDRHKRSTGHCYCCPCDRPFESSEDLNRHKKTSAHVNQFRCCECDRDFVNGTALEQHLRDRKHTFIRKRKERYICENCNRTFLSNAALKQHEGSLAHHSISNLKCGDAQCDKHFRCPSSLLHHLQSGACISGMNRNQLNSLIYAYDADKIISDQHLVKHINVRCRDCPKTFMLMHSLEQHQNSAVHACLMFHCPTSLLDGKHVSGSLDTFKTLSGLSQHLEAKVCVGGTAMLREAAAYLEGRFQQVGWKTKILIGDST